MPGSGTQGNGMSTGTRLAVFTALAGATAAAVAGALRMRHRRQTVIAEKDLGPKADAD